MPVLKNTIRTCLLLLIGLFASASLFAQPTVAEEYQLKAVFLFNFTRFVEWPPSTYSAAETALVIGVLGENPFGSYLEETASGEKANGHPIVVKHFKNPEDVKDCQILFINLKDMKKCGQVINDLKGRKILTVGDMPDFSKLGGIIRFYQSDSKIKLQINLEASKAAELVISSKLLRLSDVVGDSKNK